MDNMINKFHISSQSELTRSVDRDLASMKSELIHIGKDIDRLFKEFKERLNWTDAEHRNQKLKRIQKSRQMILEEPENLWLVYELCKDIYELAEVDHVDFNGAQSSAKISLIYKVVPFADPDALNEGVMEYHISRERENWTMHYLTEGVIEHA
jgi:hypothetical protein